jgi:uncharacterized protein
MRDVNNSITPKKSFYQRWAIWILLCVLIVAPMTFYGAAKAVQSNVNKVEDWLPKSFAETKELSWFRKNFPTDQFILISWEGCKIGNDADIPDDVRIDHLTRILRGEAVPELDANPPSATASLEPVDRSVDPIQIKKYVKSVSNGREMLRDLTKAPMNIPRDVAISRLQGSLIGPDGSQTCLVVSITPEATTHLKDVMGRGVKRPLKLREDIPPGIIHRAVAKAGITSDQVHFGGPPVDNIAIDEEGEKTLVRLAGVSGILGLFLAYWSLRSIKLTMVVFACGVLSAAASLAMIWLTGETVDAVVLSMPSLVYVLSISGAVHFINYYRDAVLESGMYRATERAAIHAIKPAFLCSLTTAFGLLSLCSSDLTPIRKFGIYSASGVMILLVVVYLYLPAALQFWQFGKRWEGEAKKAQEADLPPEERRNSISERMWAVISSWIVRHHIGVSIATVAVTLFVGWGVTRTKTSIDLLELFDSRARILQDYRWLETNIGRLVPMEIVIRFDRESQSLGNRNADTDIEELFRLTFLERLETVALIQQTIEAKFGEEGQKVVGKSLSAATFAPSLPSGSGDMGSFIKRSAYDTRLRQSRDEFIKSGFLRIDPTNGGELWRISLRVAAFKGVDYGQFVHELRDEITPITDAHDYRLQVLQELSARDQEGLFSGNKVYIWDQVATTDASEKHRHQLMISALESLLAKARIGVARIVKDPSSVPATDLEKLNKLDAVILAGQFSDSDVKFIDSGLTKVIDLKVGVAGVSTKPTVEAGSQVAEAGNQAWLSAVYTGVVPIVYKAQRELLQSLVESTVWSFLTITPLMMLVSRSLRAGMVAMIPNVMPILLVFGAMGWINISIDIGSMMSASIALGVAVDDTIHFLSWFRADLDRLKDRKAAIVSAYRRCATPTLQAAMISGLGLSVFAFSTFTPTQRFGWLMLTILIAGVASELILLPSILAGPLGKVFEPRERNHGLRRWWLIAQYELRKRMWNSTEAVDSDKHQQAA